MVFLDSQDFVLLLQPGQYFDLKSKSTNILQNYYKSPEFNILTAMKKMFKIFFSRLFYVDAKKEF